MHFQSYKNAPEIALLFVNLMSKMICKVQVLKDACRAVIQFMFTQVEHHFGNDLKHKDDHNQYDEEH